MPDQYNEMISKSLDEIDAIVENFDKDNISKAQDDEDLAPNDVADNAPEPDQEAGQEGQAPEEQGDDTDSSNEDTDADAEGEEDSGEDEEVEKSLEKDLKSDDNVRKALEVSEFLDTLVKSIAGHIDTNTKSIETHNGDLVKSLQANEQSNELLAKSLMGMVKGQKAVMEGQAELHKSIKMLNKRLKNLESQPQVRKSVQSSAQPISKSFQASAGMPPAEQGTQLTKSQISTKLFEGVQAGKVESTELLAFESMGTVGALSDTAKNYIGL